jgi:MFS transporter, PAT family, beta-lactamase induction signal transducer AmpG
LQGERSRASVLFFAGVLYFSEGLPYGIVTELFPLYLRTQGVSLAEIGLLSTVGLAWTLKLAWAPLVDLIGTYRRWITLALAAIALVLAAFGATGAATGPLFWILVTILALASATQDLAVDAFTIENTPKDLLGPVNSTRVTTYRIAIIVAGGGLAAVGSYAGWRVAFSIATAVALVILLYSLTLPAARQQAPRPSDLAEGMRRWFSRPGVGGVLAVVFLYRLGDAALAPMIKPYWVDRGFSAAEIGTVTTIVGVSFTIVGAIAGGAYVRRAGLLRGLLVLGFVQMLSNGGYAAVASTSAGRPWLYGAAVLESFCFGLGTAAFLTFLMTICERRHAATEYALLSAIFGLSRSLAGSASGWGAEAMGYAPYFWLTVLLGLPALALVPRVRPWIAEAR